MTPEQRQAAQDEMLRDANTAKSPSLWARFNNFIWPECNQCSGWKGVCIAMGFAPWIAYVLWLVLK